MKKIPTVVKDCRTCPYRAIGYTDGYHNLYGAYKESWVCTYNDRMALDDGASWYDELMEDCPLEDVSEPSEYEVGGAGDFE